MAYKRIKSAIQRAADESQSAVQMFNPNEQDV
jgi:isoquinoline 1-oxidoreductase alpha subunit